jgi:hypothetical protein
MFQRQLDVRYHAEDPTAQSAQGSQPCPIRWMDNFAMRNFTNDAVFDDTLPIADGLMEVGSRIPLDRLHSSMDDWFRRKGYLKPGDRLEITELPSPLQPS